jgi:hypothetical protein
MTSIDRNGIKRLCSRRTSLDGPEDLAHATTVLIRLFTPQGQDHSTRGLRGLSPRGSRSTSTNTSVLTTMGMARDYPFLRGNLRCKTRQAGPSCPVCRAPPRSDLLPRGLSPLGGQSTLRVAGLAEVDLASASAPPHEIAGFLMQGAMLGGRDLAGRALDERPQTFARAHGLPC